MSNPTAEKLVAELRRLVQPHGVTSIASETLFTDAADLIERMEKALFRLTWADERDGENGTRTRVAPVWVRSFARQALDGELPPSL